MNGSAEAMPPSSLVLCVEALEMEPRVMSIANAEARRPGELAVVDAADMVRPKGLVVVRSHCFVSAVLGRIGAVTALPPKPD